MTQGGAFLNTALLLAAPMQCYAMFLMCPLHCIPMHCSAGHACIACVAVTGRKRTLV